ncbi:Gfo/Idh/MocA family oxidoreductase [Sagittula salina]|uniref:Gfo/Idh/MocA family oxidoreductase n=1 Tax=Sagittula salina TaxID=2820268 RepID=UPI003CC91270
MWQRPPFSRVNTSTAKSRSPIPPTRPASWPTSPARRASSPASATPSRATPCTIWRKRSSPPARSARSRFSRAASTSTPLATPWPPSCGAPTGIVGDTGSHVFSFMEFLVGRVSALISDAYIVTATRPLPNDTDARARVTNPDGANILCRFANGARGVVDFSRTATGRKFVQSYEVYGTKGSLLYAYDEVNRLRFYTNADREGRRGFREIDVGPEHETFGAFLPLPNFALGYNESKIIEVAEVVRSVASGRPMWPTFETGHHLCQIIDACMESSRQRAWVEVS